MNNGAGFPFAVLLLVALPLTATWLFVLFDVIRQPWIPVLQKVLWIAACTVLWPTMIVYLLARRQQGRASHVATRNDPHARLVRAVADHEAGRIDGAAFAATVQQLRAPLRAGRGKHRDVPPDTEAGRVP